MSLALGVALGAVLLALRPVAPVKELPKEADRTPGVIYYVEGTRDSARSKQAAAKRKLFAQGKTVSVTEDEINSFIAPPAPPAAAKPRSRSRSMVVSLRCALHSTTWPLSRRAGPPL